MKKLLICLISLAALSFTAFAQRTAAEWKTIDNSFYTLTIPADWTAFPPEESDGIHPEERNGGPYRLCYLGWVSALNEMGENAGPMLFIEGARRLDGKPLSIRTIDAEKMKANEPPLARHAVRTELKGKPGQLRYQITKESQMMSTAGSSWYKSREFVLLQKGGETVYWLLLTVGEQYYRQHPEIQPVFEKVLDSFRPKEAEE